uniref:Uncharacterized protein n=1 Tax=Salvator merianae TaxID=96440 RepID=A0A8D0B0V5_SALMN
LSEVQGAGTQESLFCGAAEEVKKLKSQPTDQEMLVIYSPYKQAKVCLFIYLFIWTSKEDGTKAYIAKAEELKQKYGMQ